MPRPDADEIEPGPAGIQNPQSHQGETEMKLRHTRLLAAAAAVALVAAACGNDDDAATGDDAAADETDAPAGDGGEDFSAILLPKCSGIAVFDQANQGAQEAAEELGIAAPDFQAPATCEDPTGQIDIMTAAATQGVDAVMISNNAAEQIQPAVDAAADAGVTVVSWDSHLESAEGESLFISQVDFDETGRVMADMAVDILGEEGGQVAILSASPDASNQNAWIASFESVVADDAKYENIEIVDTVYGNDVDDESYNQALSLVDSHPDLDLIMAPTTVGIAAAGKAITDEGLGDQIKVSGLGLPNEMAEYTKSGVAPQFALWSFVDLGYVTMHAAYNIATGQVEAAAGETFDAGRMGDYTIEEDPTRDDALRIVMGPFTVYDEANVDEG